MRYREPFTVFPRKMKSGRIVWYYQSYNEHGRRTTALSTGQITKSAARAYCRMLEKSDDLIPNKSGRMRFKDYARHWWGDNCEYVQYRRRSGTITFNYMRGQKHYLDKYLLPQFEDFRLNEITRYDVEKWIGQLQTETSKKTGRPFANKTINGCQKALHIMLSEAVRRDLLSEDITKKIPYLRNNSKIRGVFDRAMVQQMFDYSRMPEFWESRVYYLGNLLSACTGMRMSEVIGTQLKDLKGGYIAVTKQYLYKQGFTPTKTKESREIPLPESLETMLKELSTGDPEDMLFCLGKDKSKPVTQWSMGKSLDRALRILGIDEKMRKEKGFSFHSWRHYFNTMMRSNN
ncbi:tyrosine-type recombinase/integrase, partial [Oceanispirochaeta sp.]|uniref:tyrosine-type recombinase/integrase n=1 Tax=Oceanispirochaeta sp. TaxID=2035350 RepID=UPI002622E371